MQTLSMGLAAVLTVLGLGLVAMGSWAAATGKNHLPEAIRRLQRTPASEDQERLQGKSLILNGIAGLMAALLVLLFSLRWMDNSRSTASSGRFLIVIGVAAAYFICILAAYVLHKRVRWMDAGTAKKPPSKPFSTRA